MARSSPSARSRSPAARPTPRRFTIALMLGRCLPAASACSRWAPTAAVAAVLSMMTRHVYTLERFARWPAPAPGRFEAIRSSRRHHRRARRRRSRLVQESALRPHRRRPRRRRRRYLIDQLAPNGIIDHADQAGIRWRAGADPLPTRQVERAIQQRPNLPGPLRADPGRAQRASRGGALIKRGCPQAHQQQVQAVKSRCRGPSSRGAAKTNQTAESLKSLSTLPLSTPGIVLCGVSSITDAYERASLSTFLIPEPRLRSSPCSRG